MQYQWQPMQTTMTTFSDADWAGCRDIRNSTTGGCVKIARHCVKGWSKTQSLVVLSSGESELYAMLRASAETLGFLSMAKDMGRRVHGEIWGDANAALGIINRDGLGKTRHIETGLLWIQQVAAEQRLKFGKVLGIDNPADLFTKYLDEKTKNHHVTNLGFQAIGGRPEDAPNLHNISVSMDEYQNGGCIEDWQWLKYLWGRKHNGCSNSQRQRRTSQLNVLGRQRNTTDVRQQVLQGYNWPVQGYNGSNAAQLSQPWGSNLTFQHDAGVSCGIGLRHGVTMHPRGRHSREGMILLPHGVTPITAHEQKPTQQHYYNQWSPWSNRITKQGGERPYEKCRDIDSRRHYQDTISPARRQPGELYCNFRYGIG